MCFKRYKQSYNFDMLSLRVKPALNTPRLNMEVKQKLFQFLSFS